MKTLCILACTLIGLVISFTNVTAGTRLNKKETQVSISRTPKWVEDIKINYNDQEVLRSPEHYHLYDRQYNLLGGYQKYYRLVYTLNDSSAIESGSDIKIKFDPFYEQLEIHRINVIRKGKIFNKLRKQDVQVINSEDENENNVYSGKVTALVLLEDIRKGDTIDYSFSIKGMNPVYNNKFSDFIKLGLKTDVDHFHVSINAPKAIELKLNKVGVEENIKWKEFDNKKKLELDIYSSHAYENERNLPSWYIPYPYMQVSQYSSWTDVSKWANSLFSDVQPFSESLSKYIDELKMMDKQSAINHVINFVQNNIRYLSLNIAENSHKAHGVNEVFNNRYGDCKDKAQLLSVILRAIGVDAYPALVDSDNTILMNHTLPGHDLFNHAIVMMMNDSETIWIDPTMTYQGYVYTEKYHPNYGLALVVNNKSDSGLTKMNKESQTSVSIDEQIITVDYSSPADWTISTVYKGWDAEDIRYRLAREGINKFEKRYLNYYAKSYPQIKKISSIEVEDDKYKNQIIIKEHYSVPDFWESAENKEVNFVLDADYASNYAVLPKIIKRTQPLKLYYPVTIDHKVTLQLPEHLDWSSVVSTENFGDEYISFKSTFSYDNSRVSFENKYESKKSYVDVDEIPAYLETIKKIRLNLRFLGNVSNIESYKGQEAMEDLLNSLTDL
jgi:transglutaminase-like putative cysteine protease